MKTDFLALINKLKSENSAAIHLPDFFGNINIIEPCSFTFSLGEREQILQLTSYCNEIVAKAKNGEIFFNEKNKTTFLGTVVYPKLGRFYSNNNSSIFNESVAEDHSVDQSDQLKINLQQKILDLFKSLTNTDENILKTLDGMISIKTGHGKPTGYVNCILCIQDKDEMKSKTTNFAVASKLQGNKCYWITTNFGDHIKKMHKKHLKQKVIDDLAKKQPSTNRSATKKIKSVSCTKDVKPTNIKHELNSTKFVKSSSEVNKKREPNTSIDKTIITKKTDAIFEFTEDTDEFDNETGESNSELNTSKESTMLEKFNFEISTTEEPTNLQSIHLNQSNITEVIEQNSDFQTNVTRISAIVKTNVTNSQSIGRNESQVLKVFESKNFDTSEESIKVDKSYFEISVIDDSNVSQLQSMIYQQITEQLSRMEFVSFSIKQKRRMSFYSEGKQYLLETKPISKDGNCLYGSIADQLLGIPEHKNNEKTTTASGLRKTVMDYIGLNSWKFTNEIRGQVYDKFPYEMEQSELKKKCEEKIADLKKDGIWGGSESLAAVKILFEVNILVLNESGDCYFFQGFNESIDKSIILAYRFLEDKKSRNEYTTRKHYESVISIHSEDVFSLACMIAKKMVETSKIPLKPNEVIELNE